VSPGGHEAGARDDLPGRRRLRPRVSPYRRSPPKLDSLAESAGFTRFGHETPLQVPFVAL